MSNFIVGTIQFSLLILYLFGLYVLAFDDRYTSKEFVVGTVIFPYAVYVGGKDAHRLITTSSSSRRGVERCINHLESLGASRKVRIKVCECLSENISNPDDLKGSILEAPEAMAKCS